MERVISYGGDVLKFAGDSIFVEWAVGRSMFESSDRHMYTLEQCTMVAALCAASIAETCRDFPIYNAPEAGRSAVEHAVGARVGSLNLHCVLGVGDVAAVHVGDDRLRREFLVVGDPIDQVRIIYLYVPEKHHYFLLTNIFAIPCFPIFRLPTLKNSLVLEK